MASRAAAEAAILPLWLFVALRPRFSHPSVAALLAVATLLAVLRPCVASGADADTDSLLSEIQALRLKVARLESLLEENAKTLDSKASILEGDSKLIEATERDIQLSMSEPNSAKVQELHHEVSKINSNSYIVESVARDTEKKVEALNSAVKNMEDIITEQWIQIRQLEQAFVLTKMMTSTFHKRNRLSYTVYRWPGKETIVKVQDDVVALLYVPSELQLADFFRKASRFQKAIRQHYSPDIDKHDVFFLGGYVSRSSISLPYNKFKIFMSSTQKFHHKVQVFIHDVMDSNKYTRGVANELVTFIMAYLLVVSPMWITWFLYSTWMSSRK